MRGINLGERGIKFMGAWNKTMGSWMKMWNKKWNKETCTWNKSWWNNETCTWNKNRTCGIKACIMEFKMWNYVDLKFKMWNYVEYQSGINHAYV